MSILPLNTSDLFGLEVEQPGGGVAEFRMDSVLRGENLTLRPLVAEFDLHGRDWTLECVGAEPKRNETVSTRLDCRLRFNARTRKGHRVAMACALFALLIIFGFWLSWAVAGKWPVQSIDFWVYSFALAFSCWVAGVVIAINFRCPAVSFVTRSAGGVELELSYPNFGKWHIASLKAVVPVNKLIVARRIVKVRTSLSSESARPVISKDDACLLAVSDDGRFALLHACQTAEQAVTFVTECPHLSQLARRCGGTLDVADRVVLSCKIRR